MATLIKIDGTTQTVTPRNKRRGFTCEEVYALIGCDMIERISVRNGAEENMLVDEEAKMKEGWVDRINNKATDIFAKTYGRGVDLIVGDVLMCNNKEWR